MEEQYLRDLQDKIALLECKKSMLAAEISELKLKVALLQSGRTKEDIENMLKPPSPKRCREIFEETFGTSGRSKK